MPLEALAGHFETLGSYQLSRCFYHYTGAAYMIECHFYRDALTWLQSLSQVNDFTKHLEEVGLPSIAELESYASGRKAEIDGNASTALSYYAECLALLDSMPRYAALQR